MYGQHHRGQQNHKVLLDAFDGGLSELGYQLAFVGKAGWKVDGLLERIRKHPLNRTVCISFRD